MVTSEINPRRIEASPKEISPDEELGLLLTAVGNHEAKALLLASMSMGTFYSSGDLDRLYESRQGKYKVWDLKVTPFFTYFRKSLHPAGLVEVALRGRDLEPSAYSLTDYGADKGVALAGHLLKFSEENDMPLNHLFGSTNPRWHTSLIRLRMFRALLGRDLPMREADLVKTIGESPHVVGVHLESLDRHDIIDYKSVNPRKVYANFRIKEEIPSGNLVWNRNRTLSGIILDFISRNPGAEISADTIYPLVVYNNPSLLFNEEDKRHRITYALAYFEKNGFLDRVKFTTGTKSEVNLSDEKRARLLKLMDILDRFVSGDPQFMAEGKTIAYQIANDPRRFSALLLKAREASPNANEADLSETMKQMFTILYVNPDSTVSEIQKSLKVTFQRDLSRGRVASILRILVSGSAASLSKDGKSFDIEIPVIKGKGGTYSFNTRRK